ncbi:MAG: YihY/virulence factor BrkB family protein [Spirochaetales bacterium]|nr:YihY/virulence factor BrkB family protein [Spirochaetales bacterium]
MYHVERGQNIIIKYLKYVAVIVIGLAAIILGVFLVGRFNSLSLKLRNLPDLSGFQKVFKAAVPFVLLFGLMLALTYLVPYCKVRFVSGLIGAAVGTVGVGVLGMVFKFVVQKSVKYSVIYGSLATLMFFFMFLSYLWKLVFASVIVTYVHQKRTTGIEYKS